MSHLAQLVPFNNLQGYIQSHRVSCMKASVYILSTFEKGSIHETLSIFIFTLALNHSAILTIMHLFSIL